MRFELAVQQLRDQLQAASNRIKDKESLCYDLRKQMHSTSLQQVQQSKREHTDKTEAKSSRRGSHEDPSASALSEVEDMSLSVWPSPHRFQACRQRLLQLQDREWSSPGSLMQVQMKPPPVNIPGIQHPVAFDILSREARISVKGLEADGLHFEMNIR